jgi:hypothetical protein
MLPQTHVLEVLRSLARQFWNQTCNRKSFNLCSSLRLPQPHDLEVLRSLARRFWNPTCNQKYNYNLARPASCLTQRLQGLTLMEPDLQTKGKTTVQSMLDHQAASFNFFKVLHSLASLFWNQTCNQKMLLQSILAILLIQL